MLPSAIPRGASRRQHPGCGLPSRETHAGVLSSSGSAIVGFPFPGHRSPRHRPTRSSRVRPRWIATGLDLGPCSGWHAPGSAFERRLSSRHATGGISPGSIPPGGCLVVSRPQAWSQRRDHCGRVAREVGPGRGSSPPGETHRQGHIAPARITGVTPPGQVHRDRITGALVGLSSGCPPATPALATLGRDPHRVRATPARLPRHDRRAGVRAHRSLFLGQGHARQGGPTRVSRMGVSPIGRPSASRPRW